MELWLHAFVTPALDLGELDDSVAVLTVHSN
jgi:hypothetical protein